jgi:sialate O-acetylesterase
MRKRMWAGWAAMGMLVSCGVLSAGEDDKPVAQKPGVVAGISTGNLECVVFVGDSITCGVGVKDREADRYSTVTTRLLQERWPGVAEVNLGKSGNALCQQPQDYAAEILAKKPDAVVIQWGVNDQYWGFAVARFATHYERLVEALHVARPGMPIVVTTLVPDFRWQENLDQWIGEANVAIQEIAARHGCRVADVHRAFDHRRSLYSDAIHPNTAGAEVMARTIAAALTSPPPSAGSPTVQFDQGREVRFMQYVFMPQREDLEPRWIRVANITARGMEVETQGPLAVRTAPVYAVGRYRVTVRDKAGLVISDASVPVTYHRMLLLDVDPGPSAGPLKIEVEAEPESPRSEDPPQPKP